MRKVTPAGTITTIAGMRYQDGFAGDGGPATAAMLSHPTGVAVDAQGNVYIADSSNQRVRKVSPAGTITTFAGTGTGAPGFSGDGGPATSAMLYQPRGVAVDGKGNVYIADTNNNRVRKVIPGGTITTIAGTGKAGYTGDGGLATSAQLTFPHAAAVDGHGNVYIADYGNLRVRKVSPGGKITTIAGTGVTGFLGEGGRATSAQTTGPFGVAVDAQGNVYIAEPAVGRVLTVCKVGPPVPTCLRYALVTFGGPHIGKHTIEICMFSVDLPTYTDCRCVPITPVGRH